MRGRLIASFLLAVFLGAGTTLPGLDALLHHWNGQPEESRSHIEPTGGCASHSEQCTLGRAAGGAGAAVARALVLRVETATRVRPLPAARFPVLAADRGAIPQPRAPPAPAV